MSLTPSTMLNLGTEAPDFNLPDTEGQDRSLSEFTDSKGLLVIFMCNHCPYVKHIQHALAKLADEYMDKGIAVVGISSNSVESHPQDGPDAMREEAARVGYHFPYLYDETQEVAKAYRAACTPDLFLFDASQKLVYRGQFDASRPGNKLPVTGEDLRAALDALLEGKPPLAEQKASIGCNIKWKPGNEPEYYG
ncbi:MAG: thioredoxin family protein [Acidiferrobacterales bacterium]